MPPRSEPSVPSSYAKITTLFAFCAAVTAAAIDRACQSGGTHSKRTDSGFVAFAYARRSRSCDSPAVKIVVNAAC